MVFSISCICACSICDPLWRCVCALRSFPTAFNPLIGILGLHFIKDNTNFLRVKHHLLVGKLLRETQTERRGDYVTFRQGRRIGILERISKMWMRVQGKARGGERSPAAGGMSILSRPATPPWGLRRIFEMGYRKRVLCRQGTMNDPEIGDSYEIVP